MEDEVGGVKVGDRVLRQGDGCGGAVTYLYPTGRVEVLWDDRLCGPFEEMDPSDLITVSSSITAESVLRDLADAAVRILKYLPDEPHPDTMRVYRVLADARRVLEVQG